LALAKNVGIKDSTLDLTVIYSTVRARAAAMFTRNRFPGAPVIIGRKHIANGFVQALVINSKNANVAMGKQGIDNAIETCRIVGAELGVDYRDVLPFSTGVIGRPLPMDKIRAGLRGIRNELQPNNLKLAAEAIMTTDKYPKYFSRRVGAAIMAGIAKGAGMIEPNMATMLVYLMTDAELPTKSLRPMLRRVVDRTFNSMSIDTDTSTSDTVVLMANGLVVAPGFVDLHTHYDAQINWDPYCTLSGWHGVTSIVIGNCGFGFAPCKPELRDRASTAGGHLHLHDPRFARSRSP
jgi:glutamate N-acetyltransferase/amino-acid N-acetyltransferase